MEKLFSRMFFNRIDLPRSLFAFWKKKADANCVYYRSEMNPQFKIARFPIYNSTNNLLRQSLNTSWSTLQRLLTQFFLNLIDLLRSFSKISEEKQLILTADTNSFVHRRSGTALWRYQISHLRSELHAIQFDQIRNKFKSTVSLIHFRAFFSQIKELKCHKIIHRFRRKQLIMCNVASFLKFIFEPSSSFIKKK